MIDFVGLRSQALKDISDGLAKAGQINRAFEVVQEIEDAWERSMALGEIAGELANLGQLDHALQVFDLAIQAAQKVNYAE